MVHPLSDLSAAEIIAARDVILGEHSAVVVDFRGIFLLEPPKSELQEYLSIEHSTEDSAALPQIARQAICQYDVIGSDKIPVYHESVVDVEQRKRVSHTEIGKEHHASLTLYSSLRKRQASGLALK